jgi:inner membrane protein
MDIPTHALTSFALARGFFPRRGWPMVAGMLIAGTIADLDQLSVFFGPSAYLAAHRTWTHSILATFTIAAIAAAITFYLDKTKAIPPRIILVATFVAAAAHVLMDLFQSAGETLLWPFRATRFAADYLPRIDPWILTLLLAGILLPELFRLVSSEIGAKDKSPRGRNGALVALALIVVYISARGVLHGDATDVLDAHSYRGESPRRLGAFPDPISLFTWHGIAETQSLVCLAEVPVHSAREFDAEAANCQHKPEFSTALDMAQKTSVAEKFLQSARFPRATVEKTQDGYEVTIRSLRDIVEQETSHSVAARIVLDAKPRVFSEELVWARDLRLR